MLEPAKLSCNLGPEGGVIRVVVAANTAAVIVTNSIDRAQVIPRYIKLGRVADCEAEGCYLATLD